MKITIPEVHAIDARRAAAELAGQGMVAVDDITEGLMDCAWEEIFDELGHVADGMPLKAERIETGWGPMFVMRDADHVSPEEARSAVLIQRLRPRKRGPAESVAEHHVGPEADQQALRRIEGPQRGRRGGTCVFGARERPDR